MSYVKTQWVNGDTITADKLNHIEAGIEANEAENSLVKSQLQYSVDHGYVEIDKTVNWQNGYINASGTIMSSSVSGFALIPLLAGETVRVGTNNSNITIIGSTTASSLSVGDTVTVIQKTPSASGFNEYTYKASANINIVVCVKMSDYLLYFYRESACIEEINERIDAIPEQDYTQINAISYAMNYADVSADTLSYESLDTLSETYNADGTVSFSFTETANPYAVYRALTGLEIGEDYVTTIEVISGSLAALSSQKVGTLAPSGAIFEEVSNNKRTESGKYILPFTATESTLGIQIGLIYSSKNVTVKVTTVSADGQEYLIKNSALKDIPIEALDADLQARINGNTDQFRLLYGDNNLLDGVSTTSGHYINGDTGVSTATGSAMSATDFIPLDGGTVYYYNNVYRGYWAFYSAANEASYVSGSQYSGGDGEGGGYFTVPDTANYGRFTIKNSVLSSAWINVRNVTPSDTNVYALKKNYLSYRDYPTNPCDYNGTEISVFHKCVCIGDSLTAGVCNYTEGGQSVMNVAFPNYAYPTQLAKIAGVETSNKGIAGRTTAQWYTQMSEADLSGFDMAIIQLGVNDALYNDGWTTEESTALGNIITKLKNENNNIKIFVATIIPAISYQGTAFDSVSEGIRDFVEDLADDNVVLVDLALYGHTGESIAYNNGHLTALGYFRLAEDYKAYISWIIKANPEDFRAVQFIGTSHVI